MTCWLLKPVLGFELWAFLPSKVIWITQITKPTTLYAFILKKTNIFKMCGILKNKTIKSKTCVTLTVGRPRFWFDALSEAEDQLLFCTVFSLCCLICSKWHTPRLGNDQLETSKMVIGEVSIASLGQTEWWKNAASVWTAACSLCSVSSEKNRQNVHHLSFTPFKCEILRAA